MPDGYDSHADYMGWIKADGDTRAASISSALLTVFSGFVERREIEVIKFSAMSAADLAGAIRAQPTILKPLIACCNVAGRAIDRDLNIRGLNTYSPKLTEANALLLAQYLKRFLPPELAVPALTELDRHFFADKEIRARKGRWEQQILVVLNAHSAMRFKKRRFSVNEEKFELDAAAPSDGPIQIGIDVKRIEAPRDIHKRADEILNKAAKFKMAYPKGRFATVVYYPFPDRHDEVRSRLKSKSIDGVCFASQTAEHISREVGQLLVSLGIQRSPAPRQD